MASWKGILFRQKEKEFLRHFLGPSLSLPFPSLFVYGHSSTGKTLVISDLLTKLEVPYVWVNCRETYTPQLLISSIVGQVLELGGVSSQEKSCNNICDLVNFLRFHLKETTETTVIVLDNAEILVNKKFLLLPALIRLQELSEVNITTMLVSDVVWEKFRGVTGLFEPIVLHFCDYTVEQLTEILCLDSPSGYSKEFYKCYVSIIMKVFYVVTRNLNELRHVAKLNFVKYCEPITSGVVGENNVHRLFKHIEPTLKEAIHAVFLREVSGFKWDEMLNEHPDSGNKTDASSLTKTSKFHMMKELPFYSKFLLIASYFASYNLPKSDHKHFVKNQGKQAKKRNTKKSGKNLHLLGPKAFSLDRMLSIFFSIVGQGVLPSALILSQVASLVSLQLLARVSMEEQLDTPKYKCLADLDLVVNIGKTVNIDVMNYLDDFI